MEVPVLLQYNINMKNFAQILDNVVVNTIICDDEYAKLNSLIELKNGGIGWHYDGLNFIEPDQKIDNNAMLPAVTKEQLFAELQALTNKINALNEPVSLLDKVSSLLGVK